jgi:hypothetical protein
MTLEGGWGGGFCGVLVDAFDIFGCASVSLAFCDMFLNRLRV